MKKPATPHGDLVCRFLVGGASVDDNEGAVCVASDDVGYVVYREGGNLPDGLPLCRFDAGDRASCIAACDFALSVARELVAEWASFDPDNC